MRFPKITYSGKIAVAFFVFSAVAVAWDNLTFTSPVGTTTIAEMDELDCKGTTDTALETVAATFYTYDGEFNLTKEFDGNAGTAIPMTGEWNGQWKYKNEKTKNWPVGELYLKVYNTDKGGKSGLFVTVVEGAK